MTPERGRHPVCNRCVVVAGRAYCSATHFLGAEAMTMAKECHFWRAPLDGYARDCEHQHRGFNVACRSKRAKETAEGGAHL